MLDSAEDALVCEEERSNPSEAVEAAPGVTKVVLVAELDADTITVCETVLVALEVLAASSWIQN